MMLYPSRWMLAALVISGLSVSLIACGGDDPEPVVKPEPEPDPTPVPDPTPEPDPADKATADYFAAVLAGKTPAALPETPIQASEYDSRKSKLWELWRTAVNAADAQNLPSPVDIMAINWENPIATGSWSLSDGTMHFMYGYKGAKPTDGYPLILSLHGSGNDTAEEWSITIGWDQLYKDAPSLYFIPRSPKGGTGCRWFQPSRQEAWMRLIRKALFAGTINPDRIYFMGVSEGAYGSQRLGSYFADYLAGIGPIAGGEPQYNCPAENTANLYFRQRTGELDTMYGRYRVTVKAKETWNRLAQEHPGYYSHNIEIQPGKGHGCDYDGITADLVKHARNPWPKYFYWENFGMGAGTSTGESSTWRTGFHNLRVIEGIHIGKDEWDRDAYEMTIDGNNINLKVMEVNVTPSDYVQEDGWAMNIGADRTVKDAAKGKVTIYLNDKLVDLASPVTVTVNGVKKYEGKVSLDERFMTESLAEWGDPQRIFPAAVTVTVE